MGYKMQGSKFYGKGNQSPLKKEVSYKLPKKKEKEKSNITLATDYLTKPTLYKGKKLSLKGSVDIGSGTDVGWNSKGSLTPFGSPTVDFKNKAGISGQYKIGKNTTLSGGVNWATGDKPQYKAGLKINI